MNQQPLRKPETPMILEMQVTQLSSYNDDDEFFVVAVQQTDADDPPPAWIKMGNPDLHRVSLGDTLLVTVVRQKTAKAP